MMRVSEFLKSEDGSTAIEYALIAGLVGIGIIAGMQNIRSSLQNTLSGIQSELSSANN